MRVLNIVRDIRHLTCDEAAVMAIEGADVECSGDEGLARIFKEREVLKRNEQVLQNLPKVWCASGPK